MGATKIGNAMHSRGGVDAIKDFIVKFKVIVDTTQSAFVEGMSTTPHCSFTANSTCFCFDCNINSAAELEQS